MKKLFLNIAFAAMVVFAAIAPMKEIGRAHV